MKKKVFWSDNLESLELIWRVRSLVGWDVYDELKPKFDWKKLRTRFRMILCKRTPQEESEYIRSICIKYGYIKS